MLPPNALGVLAGQVSNDSLMRNHKKSPVDVFVNVSEAEGDAPVSIQEAISYGIPVIATSVGGNTEIVSDQNGILLGPNPSPDEVARALSSMLENSQAVERKRGVVVWFGKKDMMPKLIFRRLLFDCQKSVLKINEWPALAIASFGNVFADRVCSLMANLDCLPSWCKGRNFG